MSNKHQTKEEAQMKDQVMIYKTATEYVAINNNSSETSEVKRGKRFEAVSAYCKRHGYEVCTTKEEAQ